MKQHLQRIVLALLLSIRIASSQEVENPEPSTSLDWIAVIHCNPVAGVVQLQLGDEFKTDLAPGKKVGPLALRPGVIEMHLTLGQKTITSPIELKKDQRLLALLVPDEKTGLAVKPMLLPAAEGKRLALRLPGTGDKVWKAGKKELPVGKAVEITGRPMIRDNDGNDIIQVEGEEPGFYLLVPAADEGKIKVIFLP